MDGVDRRLQRERPLGDDDCGAERLRTVVLAGGLSRGARAAGHRGDSRADAAAEMRTSGRLLAPG